MNSKRFEVRATTSFFEDLDRQLHSERGPNGEPSTTDFQTFELLNIVERFATGFEELPELVPGRSDYRVLIAAGTLIRAYTVVGQLRPDGAVERFVLCVHRATMRIRAPVRWLRTASPWLAPCGR